MNESRSGTGAARVGTAAEVVFGNTAVQYRLGGRTYAFKSSRTCLVCQSPSRFEIEEAILLGRTYAAIVRSLPVDVTGEEGITPDRLKNHANKHMPLDAAVSRAVIEQRTAEMGRALDSATGSLIDHRTVTVEVVRRAGEAMLRGELTPTLDHMLAAVKILNDEDARAETGADAEAHDKMLVAMLTAMQQVVTPEQMAGIQRRLAHNPDFMRFIMAAQAPAAIEATVREG